MSIFFKSACYANTVSNFTVVAVASSKFVGTGTNHFRHIPFTIQL